MVSKGQFFGLEWNRIARLHSQVMIGTRTHLTASRCHNKAYRDVEGRRFLFKTLLKPNKL